MSYCTGCPQLSFCDTFKNPCNITEQQLQDDTNVRVENRTYFNGITRHGYQYPVREATNPGCRDPIVGKPALKDFLPKPDETDHGKNAERFHFLDIYSGLVNGINYGKVHRLGTQKATCSISLWTHPKVLHSPYFTDGLWLVLSGY